MKCEDHRHELPCPLCALAAWPLRDLNAVADFAGKAVDDTGLVPGERTIRLSQVVRSIGRRWTELERVKLTALRPIYATKNALVREARIGAIDVGRLERAALAVARGATADNDPVVDAYVRAIIQEETDW
ncbi:hypothetical protein P9A53_gp65 [Xanthomonas phage vB_Xar_IVIA-DoCa6]|uniref:Uncharacterized protein n=1 Tax=Xanthomonas phage vB_Xar_IVIA-DoCa6 TaxID=2975533 RepID=A0A9X9JPC5_9CAUD|nr:hypothetical protein P9A52_gp72 [Stenotrophomonas phage vB_SmaS-AXL_1]YP_010739115.1 hypothetical protein P9A53_gp65 [Xanthomonas phage vB_Xar_IVIA-DoCa6]UIS24777.1 hypothetical protein AXL1_72 [Stenotrophomonas phage vB_SmaS-AXL_1]UYA98809.1 hypothetical protein IVIADoCa6_65 [Xanthomonas phage vB_Xar_IVIA-DoCa6]